MEPFDSKSLNDLLKAQKDYYRHGHTHNISFRLKQLGKLKAALHCYEEAIKEALYKDLGKGEFEAYVTEIGFVYHSISYMMKNLRKWAKPQGVKTPLHLQPSKSYILREPYGTVLIIGPFNYPFQLLMEPLIGAIAGGNCVILKPSEHTPHLSAVMERLIGETFHKSYIRLVQGGKEETSLLIHAPVDYIFFTGSPRVGKIVMEAAAKNLVPVTLELGGKSPAIVDYTANLKLAAKRIIWGKFLNAGQTCIAPDYVLVEEGVRDQFLKEMKAVLFEFFGNSPVRSKDFGRIVNQGQFDRLVTILKKDHSHILHGGHYKKESLFIEPTLTEAISWDNAAMEEELFGPILPIMTYKSLDQVIRMIQEHEKPLALYLFTSSKRMERNVFKKVSFGGGCVNDTISHVANHHLPFGGVGNSGIGAYHGKYSFDLFTHAKGIMKKSACLETGLTFPPYKNKLSLIQKVLK
jgi:aldehyde dehydrogenase (NAD+)